MIDVNKLEQLAKEAAPGPWEARNVSGAGLEIHMQHPQYPDKTWPAFGTGSAFCKKGLVSYETWVQFPNEVRDAAQARNAEYIAAANPAVILELIETQRELVEALNDLLGAWNHQMSLYEDQPVAIRAQAVIRLATGE